MYLLSGMRQQDFAPPRCPLALPEEASEGPARGLTERLDSVGGNVTGKNYEGRNGGPSALALGQPGSGGSVARDWDEA